MRQKRFLAILLVGTISFSALSFSACKSTASSQSESTYSYTSKEATGSDTSVSGEDTDAAEVSEPETTTPRPTPTPVDPAELCKEMALTRAEEVGLTEDDLRGKYEFFLHYADTVEKSADLEEYRGYVYQLFPLIADNLQPENEDYFCSRVKTLCIYTEATVPDYSGWFSSGKNHICVCSSNLSSTEEWMGFVIYHELIHFIDSAIDGPQSMTFYVNGEFRDGEDMRDSDWQNNPVYMDAAIIVEGAAEYYPGVYFHHCLSAVSTYTYGQYFGALEYVLGHDLLAEIFYAHNTCSRFAEVLSDCGFSGKEIMQYLHGTEFYFGDKEYEAKDLMHPLEGLIRIYEARIGPDYAEDPVFRYLLGACPCHSLDYLLSDETQALLDEINAEREAMREKNDEWMELFADDYPTADEIFLDSFPPYLILLDGKPYLTEKVNGFGSGATDQAVIFDYDFETGELLGFETRQDWVPQDPIPKLSSETSEEAQKLIESKTMDNSAAHNQHDRYGTNAKLTDLYERAMEIGSRYGIYIYFADLIPEAILPNEQWNTPDPDKLAKALDELETVLSLYPEDYFDQLLFGYYHGINLYLYEGNYDYFLPEVVLEEDECYMSIFLNLNMTEVPDYCGAETIRADYFPDISAFSARFICDIWDRTEKFIRNYNENFEEPIAGEEAWMEGNYPYTSYAECIEDTWISLYYENEPERQPYFLLRESCISIKIDQALLYEYMMLNALQTQINGGECITAPLNDECWNKADILCSFLRHVFNTDTWEETTSWEEALEEIKG